MKALFLVVFTVLFISCSPGIQVSKANSSVIKIINVEHEKKVGIKKGAPFYSFDKFIYKLRDTAAQLYGIDTDTARINSFIVIDMISFTGGNTTTGEMIVNYSARYYYKKGPVKRTTEKYDWPVESEKTIVNYLKKHQFEELEKLAEEKGKRLSGSFFFYIGMYEKGKPVYANLLPAFMDR